MEFYDLIQRVIHDTLDTSLPLFWPELILCLTIFVLLAARVVSTRIEMSFPLAIAGLLLALLVPQGGQPWRILLAGDELVRTEIFTGMLVYDGFTLFMRGLLISFAILLLVLTRITNVFDRRDGTDIYTLVIGATLGMCLMASANHLLMVFLAVEIASVPSYVLAGMRKTQRLSSEAALKYSEYGAGTAGQERGEIHGDRAEGRCGRPCASGNSNSKPDTNHAPPAPGALAHPLSGLECY